MTHLRVLACDLDGTLQEGDQVSSQTWEALRRAKAAGFLLMLVTGRRLEAFDSKGLFAELCAAIVAEDGAVVYFPRRDSVVLPFGQLDSLLLQQLAALMVPLEYGRALVATHVPFDEPILQVLRARGGGATVEYNRGAVMVLPAGATKGTGLQYALQELGYSSHNVIACGDAENDRSLFGMAEVGVAVANAAPEIQSLADLITPHPNGAGVRWLIDQLLTGQLPPYPSRHKRRLLLGNDLTETPVLLDPGRLLNGNLGIFGASSSGKSWVAGLLAEQMLTQGYHVCIIDPEGDYRSLHAFPHTLALGGTATELPPVVDLLTLEEYSQLSLVLDLSTYSLEHRIGYITELLQALRGLRRQRGQPHWLLLDEVHSLCPPGNGELNRLCQDLMQEGGVGMVSYRPSQVDSALLGMLDHWMLTCTRFPEEINVLEQYFPDSHLKESVLQMLPTLPQGQVYLICTRTEQVGGAENLITFRAGQRIAPHVRHLYKYLQAPLPTPKRFYFCDSTGRFIGRTAASLAEFNEALCDVPLAALEYHLHREDFERWLRNTLHDEVLARQMHKLAHRKLRGEELRREIVNLVDERYAMLVGLT